MKALLFLILASLAWLFGGCSGPGGPAERAGRSVDNAVYNTGADVEHTGQKVGAGQAERGILICGTGIGMCIAANKFPGVRAAPCHDDLTAELSRRHIYRSHGQEMYLVIPRYTISPFGIINENRLPVRG